MRNSITTRLVLAMSGLTVAVLVATLALAWWSFRFGFLNYINAQETGRLKNTAGDLARWYEREGSWQTLDERRFRRLVSRHQPPPARRPRRHDGPPARGAPPPPGHAPVTWLEDVTGSPIAGRAQAGQSLSVPVEVRGVQVATLHAPLRQALAEPLQTQFAAQQLQTMAVIAGVALALALIIAFFLSRALLAPIRRTISGVEALASGRYDTRFEERRQDELGDLAINLDRLARHLEASQSARRRWLADISHELRTPVSVLRAELDAVEDGVRALDAAQLSSFGQEVRRISDLIDDLYDLALSDIGGLRYDFGQVDLVPLISAQLDDCARRHPELDLTLNAPDRCGVRGDEKRLTQLFVNLLENACAYTDAPGCIECSVRTDGRDVLIDVDDSPPGLPDTALSRLFDPLFRHDAARDRRTGGAGLGLSICANIVRAHGGDITAGPAPLGGVRIAVRLEAA